MFLAYFLFSFLLSCITTFFVIVLMRKMAIFDKAKKQSRKIHKKDIPLGGGLAIFISVFLLIFSLLLSKSHFFYIDVLPRQILGLFVGSIIIMVGGFLDDKYDLRPRYQILFPILASLSIIFFGIGPHFITNPFGLGTIDLSRFTFKIFNFGNFVLLADLLVFVWLMLMMYATKFLDGLDGLASGVSFIGSIVIFFLSLQDKWYQPDVAMLAIIFAGACLGFLLWNWSPAKIFLGEGGSIFLGFFLGVLAIISGGKIATTMLVMAIPILDIFRVIIIRWKKGQAIYKGDNEHIHHKLLKIGFSQKQTVLILFFFSFLCGMGALFFQTGGKVLTFIFLSIVMLMILFFSSVKNKKYEFKK